VVFLAWPNIAAGRAVVARAGRGNHPERLPAKPPDWLGHPERLSGQREDFCAACGVNPARVAALAAMVQELLP